MFFMDLLVAGVDYVHISMGPEQNFFTIRVKKGDKMFYHTVSVLTMLSFKGRPEDFEALIIREIKDLIMLEEGRDVKKD